MHITTGVLWMTFGLQIFNQNNERIFDSSTFPYRFTHKNLTPSLINVRKGGRNISVQGVRLGDASKYAIASLDIRGSTIRTLGGRVLPFQGWVDLTRDEANGEVVAIIYAYQGVDAATTGHVDPVGSNPVWPTLVNPPRIYILDRKPSKSLDIFGLEVFDEYGDIVLSSSDTLPNVLEVKTIRTETMISGTSDRLIFFQGYAPPEYAAGSDEYLSSIVYLSGTRLYLVTYELWYEYFSEYVTYNGKKSSKFFTVMITEIPQM